MLIDTQEKQYAHVLEYFNSQNIQTERKGLLVGDYCFLENMMLSVDRKKDILELAGNICGKDHRRFHNECVLAQKLGVKLIVLCEEMHNYNTLCKWESPLYGKYSKYAGQPKSKVKGETLAKAMATMQLRYGVKFKFCNREDVGRRIVEILTKGE